MKAWYNRKKAVLILALCLIFCSFTLPMVYGEVITKMIQVTYRNISLWVNGKLIPSEQEPFVYEGRTFVPLRTIAEALDKEVNWNNTENKVLITDKASPRTMNIPIHSLGERFTSERFEISVLEAYISDKYPPPREEAPSQGDMLIIKLRFEYHGNTEGKGQVELNSTPPAPFYFMNSHGIIEKYELKLTGDYKSFFNESEEFDKELYLICRQWNSTITSDDLVLIFNPVNGYTPPAFYSFAAFDIGEITIREE